MDKITYFMMYDDSGLTPFKFVGELQLVDNEEYGICYQKDGITVWCSNNTAVTNLLKELFCLPEFADKSLSYIFDEIVRCEFFGKIDDVLYDMLNYN